MPDPLKAAFEMALEDFFLASSVEEFFKAITKHPELLDDDMDCFLEDVITNARNAGKESMAQTLEGKYLELKRVRPMLREKWLPQRNADPSIPKSPIQQALEFNFGSKLVHAYILATTPQELAAAVQEYPELLTEESDSYFEYFSENLSKDSIPEDVELILAKHKELKELRQKLIEARAAFFPNLH